MPRQNETRLLGEMLEAYRGDLEEAVARWWASTVAVSAADPGSPDQLQAANRLLQAQTALDGAHPFLHRQFLQRLKSLMVERWSQRPGADVNDPFEAVEVARLVNQVLLEAQDAAVADAGTVNRHLVEG